MLILSGCTKTVVKTVKVDYFCEGKYRPLILIKKDFNNINEIRKNLTYKETMDKYIKYHAINQREFKVCSLKK